MGVHVALANRKQFRYHRNGVRRCVISFVLLIALLFDMNFGALFLPAMRALISHTHVRTLQLTLIAALTLQILVQTQYILLHGCRLLYHQLHSAFTRQPRTIARLSDAEGARRSADGLDNTFSLLSDCSLPADWLAHSVWSEQLSAHTPGGANVHNSSLTGPAHSFGEALCGDWCNSTHSSSWIYSQRAPASYQLNSSADISFNSSNISSQQQQHFTRSQSFSFINNMGASPLNSTFNSSASDCSLRFSSFMNSSDQNSPMSPLATTQSSFTPPFSSQQNDSTQLLPYQVSVEVPADSGSAPFSSGTEQNQSQALLTKPSLTYQQLFYYTKNLRIWLSKTILERFVSQVALVNKDLANHGLSDVQIGEASVEKLRKVSHIVPGVTDLLPFLSCSNYQDYLVNRITELTKGGCMQGYSWDTGGSYKSRVWDEHLPSDANIIIHLFISYLDSRLPPHPSSPEGQVFSSRHFACAPSAPDVGSHGNALLLLQSTIRPPHFRLVCGNQHTVDMDKGKNNLFHTIIAFIYMVREHHQSRLHRIHMGASGLNMLWIIEDPLQ